MFTSSIRGNCVKAKQVSQEGEQCSSCKSKEVGVRFQFEADPTRYDLTASFALSWIVYQKQVWPNESQRTNCTSGKVKSVRIAPIDDDLCVQGICEYRLRNTG